jgi:MoxR-like ATPases
MSLQEEAAQASASQASYKADSEKIDQSIQEMSRKVAAILLELDKRIIGQKSITERLLMAMIAQGHVLLEGLPGLAKTTAIKSLAEVADLSFKRIQFTPDLLPADLIGTPNL